MNNFIFAFALIKYFSDVERAKAKAYQQLHGAFNKDTADGFDSNTNVSGNS